jgi:hypothetical protein
MKKTHIVLHISLLSQPGLCKVCPLQDVEIKYEYNSYRLSSSKKASMALFPLGLDAPPGGEGD